MDSSAQPAQQNNPIPVSNPSVPNPMSGVNSSLQTPRPSYADSYAPPAGDPSLSGAANAANGRAQADYYRQPAQPSLDSDLPQPAQAAPAAASQPAASSDASQDLADQNIFDMLGVTTGTPEQREQFLDELQQVIWEDFIENDTKLLLTDSEQQELQRILQSQQDKSMEQQEEAVVYLEKLIPDLEDIMLEKALQLKEELVRERLRALRELYRDDAARMASLDAAEQAMSQKQWRSAAAALNG